MNQLTSFLLTLKWITFRFKVMQMTFILYSKYYEAIQQLCVLKTPPNVFFFFLLNIMFYAYTVYGFTLKMWQSESNIGCECYTYIFLTKGYFKNKSLKGSFWNPKWFFTGIAVKTHFWNHFWSKDAQLNA